MSMGDWYEPGNEVTGYLLRVFGQLIGFVLAVSAFALWLQPAAGEGLSLGRLGLSLAMLLGGMAAVFGCAGRR